VTDDCEKDKPEATCNGSGLVLINIVYRNLPGAEENQEML